MGVRPAECFLRSVPELFDRGRTDDEEEDGEAPTDDLCFGEVPSFLITKQNKTKPSAFKRTLSWSKHKI
jgi:hypothetical protein